MKLTDYQKEIIRSMAANRLHAAGVARAMHVAASGLIYQFEKIKKNTGLDPRDFYDCQKLLQIIDREERFDEIQRSATLSEIVDELLSKNLAELSNEDICGADIEWCLSELKDILEFMNDGLLAVLPCKPGDDLYWIDTLGEEPEIVCEYGGVKAVVCYEGNRFGIIDNDHDIHDIGTRFSLLSYEAAEKYLKNMEVEK